jgi:hypothetical protein
MRIRICAILMFFIQLPFGCSVKPTFSACECLCLCVALPFWLIRTLLPVPDAVHVARVVNCEICI